METSLWILLVLFLFFRLHAKTRASGRLTIAPGEGFIMVTTPFHPKHVELEFVGCNPVPGCSQLEDEAVVSSTDCYGFTIRYSIKSGVRVLKWRACA